MALKIFGGTFKPKYYEGTDSPDLVNGAYKELNDILKLNLDALEYTGELEINSGGTGAGDKSTALSNLTKMMTADSTSISDGTALPAYKVATGISGYRNFLQVWNYIKTKITGGGIAPSDIGAAPASTTETANNALSLAQTNETDIATLDSEVAALQNDVGGLEFKSASVTLTKDSGTNMSGSVDLSASTPPTMAFFVAANMVRAGDLSIEPFVSGVQISASTIYVWAMTQTEVNSITGVVYYR